MVMERSLASMTTAVLTDDVGARKVQSRSQTNSQKTQRQNTRPAAELPSKPKSRNPRNLSIQPSPPPLIKTTPSLNTSNYSSLGETASSIASQRNLLSPTPPPILPSATPRFVPIPLQTIPSSRPGTPALHPSSAFGRPQTPSLGLAPLTPTTPAGAVFSPNASLFSPTALSPASTKTSRLKSQLTSLLPVLPAKHTHFHAKIEVQQLSSVPFVGGQFGVRWKFKNVHRHPGAANQEEGSAHGNGNEEAQGLLGRVTGRAKHAASSGGKDKGKARAQEVIGEFVTPDVPVTHHHAQQSSIVSTGTNSGGDTTTTSGSFTSASTSTWSSTSASSLQSSSSTATKIAQAGRSTPNTNLSRNFYSQYNPSNGSTVSPNSTEAIYGPSQYLFVDPAAGEGSATPSLSSAVSTPADPTGPLLFSPNNIPPAGTVAQAIGNNTNNISRPGTPLLKGNGQLAGGPQAQQIGHLSAARGMTRFLPLKDHSVHFNFPLETIVKMVVMRSGASSSAPLDAEGHEASAFLGQGLGGLNPNDPPLHSHSSASVSSMFSPTASIAAAQQQQQQAQMKPNLQPSPFKLVVMQRVIPDDPSSTPNNPRLGAVFINLAEYVGKGKVERRFLLKESKVNATLKLSIEVTYMSGYTGFVAPPLRKAEILGGIEGFLTQRETKKKTLPLNGTSNTRDPAHAKGRGATINEGNLEAKGADEEEGEVEVDLLARGLLEREKDRIGEGLLAGVKTKEIETLAGMATRIVAGWDDEAQAVVHVGVDLNVHAREDVDPYALPSDTETESEYGASLNVRDAVVVQDKVLTEEVLGRKRWKEEMRAKRRVEREDTRRMSSSLSESEDDNSAFESADEGPCIGGKQDKGLAKDVVSAATSNDLLPHLRVSAFDVQHLPLSYGPKTTENLIDALFNPSLTTDMGSQGPFTLYVSPGQMQATEEELRREMEMVHAQQLQVLQYQERFLLEEQRRQHPRHQQSHHWYQTKKRSISRDTASSDGGSGGHGKSTMKNGVRRKETMDSFSTSTASGSGSGSSPGVPVVGMKSPGEDTVVGVKMGDEDADDPDAVSPATITALSPNRDRGQWVGLGVAMEGTVASTPADSRDSNTTIGKTGSVGHFLHNYYRAKKDKSGGKKGNAKEKEQETSNILGRGYYEQEPQEMYEHLGHGPPPAVTVHRRSLTSGTISSTSSSSLSSLSLDSRSASGHGHNAGTVQGGPPRLLGAASGVTDGTVAGPDVRRNSSVRSTGTGDGHMATPVRLRQPDLSVPDGRMDKMGVVKGTSMPPTPIIGVQDSGELGGFGSSLKGWWKGLQK